MTHVMRDNANLGKTTSIDHRTPPKSDQLHTRLDRLARSTKDLLNMVSEFEEQGIDLVVLEQNIDTKTPEGRLFFTMIAAFAEFEHGILVARTRDGLAAARSRGRVGGRKPKMTTARAAEARRLNEAGERTVKEIADLFGVSRPTVYRSLEPRRGIGVIG